MNAPNLASILLYIAVLFHLLLMSGWVSAKMSQPIQLAMLALMLLALFVLRKKKRKTKRRTRRPPAEVAALVDRAEEGEPGQ
ncbi:LPXTG cell wall anchor domain-containing protein [Brevibacillus sp. FSL K6-0770]|uniref:LPXTG cell wall anchor domain-containing protein n=1 Tax=Brevibacillus sp. FSL K6-0770 TaxID=2954673 RepID=UPI0030F9525B